MILTTGEKMVWAAVFGSKYDRIVGSNSATEVACAAILDLRRRAGYGAARNEEEEMIEDMLEDR